MGIDVLAIGAHPDDVELAIGASVAKLVDRGYDVVLLDLTRGEMGSRGTPEIRAEEAAAAAKALGAKSRISLDMGDGILMDNLDNRKAVIEVIRAERPSLVLTPYWDDLHPDHAAAGKLVRAVMYPVGFANYPAKGEPFRPNEVLFYMMHTPFDPSFIFDVSGYWEKKLEAIQCFSSQVGPTADDDLEPPTNLSSPDFFRRLEGRSRHFGHLIGKTFGDAYTTVRPVPMDDPVAHYGPFDKLSSTRKASGEGVA